LIFNAFPRSSVEELKFPWWTEPHPKEASPLLRHTRWQITEFGELSVWLTCLPVTRGIKEIIQAIANEFQRVTSDHPGLYYYITLGRICFGNCRDMSWI